MTVFDSHNNNNKYLSDYGFINPVPIKERGGVENMKRKVEQSITLEDGKHTGIIDSVEYRTEPYEYVDVVIKETETKLNIKCGYPFTITDNTALGIALIRFGAKLEVDKEVDPDEYFKVGAEVEFMTLTEDTKKGRFARIISESLKLK